MPLDRSFPNQFNDKTTFTSTGADLGFGFNASFVRVKNDAAKSVYVRLNSTTGATTADHEVASSEDMQWYDLGVGVAGLSYCATSSGGAIRVGAWG